MKVKISGAGRDNDLDIEGQEARVQQMMRMFVAEQFTAAIMEEPDAQVMFARWLDERESNSSRETRRREWRSLLRMADSHPRLKTLHDEVEERLINDRNIVPNKAINVGLSRMIDEGFLRRIQRAIESQPGITEHQRHAFILFSATLMTGLRISEWPEATLDLPGTTPAAAEGNDRNAILRVKGAKAKKDEHRPRSLILEGFTPTHQHIIKSAIEIAQSLTMTQMGKLSTSLRKISEFGIGSEDQLELLAELDLKTGRKMYTVEALRDGRAKKQVAGTLGHTTTVNLRWYAHGDIYRDRAMRYPLARVAEDDAQKVRDTLKEYEERKRQQKEEQEEGDKTKLNMGSLQ
jgi:hypothetical protein